MEDRRVFGRIGVNFGLKFTDIASGREGAAQAFNISANGVGFITKELLVVNTPLEICLMVPDHHEPFYVRGEVVWSLPLADNGEYRVGIHLSKENFIGVARALWIKQTAP